MWITKEEHEIISNYFPFYNREKSYIKCETTSGDKPEFFIVHIYRKGKFQYKDGVFAKMR